MKNDLSKTIGQKLQMLRLQKGLTQEQLGEKLNLSTSAYCKIEYGETELTLPRLYKIAEVLSVSPLELFKILNGSLSATTECETDELYKFIKINSRMIDMLFTRIEALEKKVFEDQY